MAEGLYVIVSGSPGSGKTTVGRGLAQRLGLPLLSKDTIKEALMAALDVPDVEASQRIGRAAIAVMHAIAVDAGRGVLESVWRPALARPELQALPGMVVEVWCRCPAEVARARYVERGAGRHRGHFDAERSAEQLWGPETAGPIDGGWPVIEVDTTGHVDLDALTVRVRDVALAPP